MRINSAHNVAREPMECRLINRRPRFLDGTLFLLRAAAGIASRFPHRGGQIRLHEGLLVFF